MFRAPNVVERRQGDGRRRRPIERRRRLRLDSTGQQEVRVHEVDARDVHAVVATEVSLVAEDDLVVSRSHWKSNISIV